MKAFYPRPNLSEIRNELLAGNDRITEPFEFDFNSFEVDVLATVRRNRRCSERQTEVLASACNVAWIRIVRRLEEEQ